MNLNRFDNDPDCVLALHLGDLQHLRDRYTVASNPSVVDSPHYNALSLDGTDDKVVIGNVSGTIKTVVLQCKLGTTTEELLDFDSGTNYLSATSGTLAVASCADEVLYVDESQTAAITAGAWHTVAFTTATGITVSNLQVGTDNTGFGNITVAGLLLYTRILTATEIEDICKMEAF